MGLSHTHFGWDLKKNIHHISKYLSDHGYITALFRFQHITYQEETLGFKIIFPERPADQVIHNLKDFLNNSFIEKHFYIERNFIEPHRSLILVMLNHLHLKEFLYQVTYQLILKAKKSL